jgi:hypothetical protein
MTTRQAPGTLITKRTWDERLARDVDSGSLLTALSGLGTGSKKAPDSIFMRKTLGTKVGDEIMKLLLPLRGNGYTANEISETVAERLRFLVDKAPVAEYGHVVQVPGKKTIQGHLFGSDNDAARATESLSTWGNQRKDRLIHQAICEVFDGNIVASGLYDYATAGINPNMVIAGLDWTQQPAYDSTLIDYKNAIVAALSLVPYNPAGGGFDPANDVKTSDLNSLATTLRTRMRIQGAGGDFNGKIAMLLHPFAAEGLRDPASTVSLKGLQRTTFSEKFADMAWADDVDLGPVRNLLLLEDQRAAYLVLDIEGDGSIQFVYRDVGETDQRDAYMNTATQMVFCVNPCLGQGALIHTTASPWAFDDETKDIGRAQLVRGGAIEGFHARGYDEPVLTDVSDESMYARYSALFITQSGSNGGAPTGA